MKVVDPTLQVVAPIPETQDTSERLALLNWASQVINAASLNPAELYQAIQQTISWLMPADVCILSLLDESKQGVKETSYTREGQIQPVRRYPLAGSVVQYVLENNAALPITELVERSAHISESGNHGWLEGFGSGLAVRLQRGETLLGMLSIQSYQPDAYSQADILLFESFAIHVAIALENAHLHEQLQHAAIIAERQRLARDLHDTVTQLLYSITLFSRGWRDMAADHRLENPADSFAQLEQIGSQALKEMRLLLYQLRPSLLEKEGLVSALQNRLETVEQRVNLDTRLLLGGKVPPMTKTVEEELYRIAMEALNNALKHAEASSITIRLLSDCGRFTLSVTDDGIGFDPAQISTGMGFDSMRERAEAIGGCLQVVSKPCEETTVSVSLQIPSNEEA